MITFCDTTEVNLNYVIVPMTPEYGSVMVPLHLFLKVRNEYRFVAHDYFHIMMDEHGDHIPSDYTCDEVFAIFASHYGEDIVFGDNVQQWKSDAELITT